MNTEQIRKSYLDFFTERKHVAVKRAPLVLDDDPTTLFTGSGMQPMIPYLLGEAHPDGKRIVDSQTCLRAQDIDEIGDNRHTTFFEMLGNWSMGDYFKSQQIEWMFEFLSDVVKLNMDNIYITCYSGNSRLGIPKDSDAADIWKGLFESKGLASDVADIGSEDDGYKRGMKPGERIFYYDGTKNWWSRNGDEDGTPVGDPCGPDSEMFYDFGTPHDGSYGEFCHPNCDCGRFMEIGNNVFMAYKKTGDGKFEELEQKNVDHGSGLERIAAAKLGDPDVFKISLLWPVIEKLQDLSGKKYDSNTSSMRVIADHLRAATFLAVDGCKPSNKQQGYVMRRLLRRAILKAFDLGIEQNFMQEAVQVIADLYVSDFPEVKARRDEVIAVLVKEEKVFRQTLRKGLREFDKIFGQTSKQASSETVELRHDESSSSSLRPAELAALGQSSDEQEEANSSSGKSKASSKARLDVGVTLFTLYDTYGFPVELSVEEMFKRGIDLPDDWREQFDAKMEEQRNRSRTASKGDFKGGLEGGDLIHKKYHTATHLLQSALRKTFGPELRQHGSNITEDRLRFDFNLDRKMTDEEKRSVEDLVNGWISDDLPVSYKIYPTPQALDMGAIGPFGERYDSEVKVYQMGNDGNVASLEICGGPHVDHTGQLGEDGKKFKITKEQSSSAGIRRIKAVLK